MTLSTMTLSPGAREYVLSLADDEHIIGARHTSWIGLGPFLEEDLAFCSIAQDELGHAIALYELLVDDGSEDDGSDDDGSVDGRSADAAARRLDAFALLRDPGDYRSCHLAERECSEWSDSLVRHWLYDRAETIRWNALLESSSDRLAAIAARALREEAFHLEHAAQFMARITPDKPEQIMSSIHTLLPLAVGIWDDVAGETEALSEGITSASSSELSERWEVAVRSDLVGWGLDIEWPTGESAEATANAQANRRRRSVGFDHLQSSLRKVIDLDPAARW